MRYPGSVTLIRCLIIGLCLVSVHDRGSSCLGQGKVGRLDSYAEEHRRLVRRNPESVSLVLRQQEGKTRWMQGEAIRIELEFSTDKRGAYLFDNALQDRSGRLGIDAFHLDPEGGATDPLNDYFHGQRSGFMGGISSSGPLEDESRVISYELNEWFRFNKPGKYRLYVTSGRISSSGQRHELIREALPVVSNIIEFEVLPRDEKWQEEALREAVATLETLDQPNADGLEAEVKRVSSCRTLRFLSTEGAALEMIRLLGKSDNRCAFEYFLGLIGSPHRELIVKEMEKKIADPSQPVSGIYLNILSHVAMGLKFASEPLAPYPAGQEAKIKLWQESFKKRFDAQNQLLLMYGRKLYAALPGKVPEARALSIATLLGMKSSIPPDQITEEVTSWSEKLPAELASSLPGLAPELQARLLHPDWVNMAGVSIVPTLKRLFENPPKVTDQNFRDSMLQQIYELSPADGRELILKEAVRARPRVSYSVLGLLKEETFPELDDALATNLEKNVPYEEPTLEGGDEQYKSVETISQLIEKYASPAILPRVKSVYKKIPANSWGCLPQAALLAYISRTEPATGKELVLEALKSRDEEKSRCFTSVLVDVADRHMTRELEDVAIDALSDDNPEVVNSAARVLGAEGSAAAEEKIWRRLEEWHAKWQDHSAELREKRSSLPEEGVDPLSVEALIEEALVRALAEGQGWLADTEHLKRLRTLCITNTSCKYIEGLLNAGPPTISVTFDETGGKPRYLNISQYGPLSLEALKRKVAQYPAGTVFRLEARTSIGKGTENFIEELRTYLETRGYKIRTQ